MSDDVIENVRLWLADPLAVNWARKATVQALIDEIDRLRAEVEGAKRIPKVSNDGFCLSVRGDLRCENPIGHDGFHWNESHRVAWTDDSAPASYTVRPQRRTPA